MRYSAKYQRQREFLRRQFLQNGKAPFADVLSSECIDTALNTIFACWNDCIYTPLVTLWVFLGQVLSVDHSCRGAVARLVAHRASCGLNPCSSKTGAYCRARKKLPEEFFATIARTVGRRLTDQAERQWLWKGRHVYMFDGTTISMPDTKSNQNSYPQSSKQTPGVGFPLARVGAVLSLACGAILDLGVAAYSGKGQGEITLLRQLWSLFQPGDVLLADSLMCNWRNLYELRQRDIDVVTRLNKALRKADFRKGQRLGKDDHLVEWPKPHIREVGRAAQRAMPRCITVREARVRIHQPGFRSRVLIVVTTLLDPVETSIEDLADLYRKRWNQELDFCSLKVALQMDVLRCKTPELVRKEIWTHMLAYNLIRTIIAQSASRHKILPRSISFKGTLQILDAFQPFLEVAKTSQEHQIDLYEELLDAIAVQRIADRPDRFEPRLRKRRFKKYDYMMKPRDETKIDILKQLKKK